KRNPNLDLLRIAACLAVVMLHTSARTIYLYGEVSALSWNAADLINSATRWCVPVFVMISGALIASRPIADPASFMIRRASTIVVPIIVWSAAYLCWRSAVHGEHFTALSAAKELFSGAPYYHLYFLFLIGGLYIFAPVVAAALSFLPPRPALTSAVAALV